MRVPGRIETDLRVGACLIFWAVVGGFGVATLIRHFGGL